MRASRHLLLLEAGGVRARGAQLNRREARRVESPAASSDAVVEAAGANIGLVAFERTGGTVQLRFRR